MDGIQHYWDIFTQLKGLGVGAVALKIGQWLFCVRHTDIPVCHTRIMRTKRGLPWNEQIGVHPLADGRLQLTPIREEPEQEFEHFTRNESYKALRKASRRIKK